MRKVLKDAAECAASLDAARKRLDMIERFRNNPVDDDGVATIAAHTFIAVDELENVVRAMLSSGDVARDEYAKIGAEWINRDGVATMSPLPGDERGPLDVTHGAEELEARPVPAIKDVRARLQLQHRARTAYLHGCLAALDQARRLIDSDRTRSGANCSANNDAVDELEKVARAMLAADVGALEFKRTMAEALEAQAHSIDTIERYIERTSAIGRAWPGRPRFVQLVVQEDATLFALDSEGRVWCKEYAEDAWERASGDHRVKIGDATFNRDGVATMSTLPGDERGPLDVAHGAEELENARALVMAAARDLVHRIAADDRSDEEQEGVAIASRKRNFWPWHRCLISAVHALEVIEQKQAPIGGAS
jgi:hypothetical protein